VLDTKTGWPTDRRSPIRSSCTTLTLAGQKNMVMDLAEPGTKNGYADEGQQQMLLCAMAMEYVFWFT
jgi:hypothetical protein